MLRPAHIDDVEAALASPARAAGGLIARGAGRSYGDAAQNEGGAVLDMTGLDRVLSVDAERGLVTCQAGATIAMVMAALAPHGLTLPVVPGTRHVTIGGAVASDVHGKNHHRDGCLGRHVAALSLCTPAHGRVELSPDGDPELFYATLGGMGLTGVVVQATLRAEPLASRWVAADLDRSDGLAQTLELLGEPEQHRYSVAWLDLLARGPRFGRAVVSRADPLGADHVPTGEAPSGAGLRTSRGPRRSRGAPVDALLRAPALRIPRTLPGALLHPELVRAFNALRWRASPRRQRARPQPLVPFFFPLDGLGDWNRLYGPAGLMQYQFVVPLGRDADLMRCFELMRARRLPVYLAVLKRFGPSFGGPLSFPLAGWTLAADVPARAPGVRETLDELDEVVAGCGGRVYLTKDARLRPDVLGAMYPQLERFDVQRARVDPQGTLRSDLARRLGLCAVAA